LKPKALGLGCLAHGRIALFEEVQTLNFEKRINEQQPSYEIWISCQ